MLKGKRVARENVFHFPGAMRKNRRFVFISASAHKADKLNDLIKH